MFGRRMFIISKDYKEMNSPGFSSWMTIPPTTPPTLPSRPQRCRCTSNILPSLDPHLTKARYWFAITCLIASNGRSARTRSSCSIRAEVRGEQYQAYDKLPNEARQEYRQNEARSAAAAGVVIGGARQRQQRREQAAAQEQQAAQADAAATAYQQAYNAYT
jgi:hypothetical protein